MVLGGVVMTAWGGFKRRINGVLWGWTYCGLIGTAILGLNFGLPLWIVGMVLGGLLHAADQQLQPGHLAIQGGAGSAGAGLLRQAPDRLVRQPDLTDHRRHTGGLCAGAGHADGFTTVIHVWLAGGHWSGGRHGFAADHLRYSHGAGGGGGIIHSQNPECRNDPAGFCPGG